MIHVYIIYHILYDISRLSAILSGCSGIHAHLFVVYYIHLCALGFIAPFCRTLAHVISILHKHNKLQLFHGTVERIRRRRAKRNARSLARSRIHRVALNLCTICTFCAAHPSSYLFVASISLPVQVFAGACGGKLSSGYLSCGIGVLS